MERQQHSIGHQIGGEVLKGPVGIVTFGRQGCKIGFCGAAIGHTAGLTGLTIAAKVLAIAGERAMHKWIVGTLLVLATVICGLIYLIAAQADSGLDQRRAYGIAKMTTGLLVLWVWLGGGLMYRFRNAVRPLVRALPLDWRLTFVLFATALALTEEAITVTMTNLAPLFGSRIGEAYITASTNYLDVIALHSVVVFVPYFVALALILARYDFKPFAVFVSFGVVGTFSEAVFAANPLVGLAFPLWVFVYGLMVWWPCYCLPERRGAHPVGLLHHLMLPVATVALALPMILPIVYVISVVLRHPAIDFAP